MTPRLIVNADDYGHTDGVSAGIREAYQVGIVTSTSAMMNKPAVVTALEAAKACPGLGIGVHLVLTSGSPLLPAEKVPSLVTPEKKFHNQEGFIKHIHDIDLAEVWAEWNAQVEKFVALSGRAPDHLDSHHHSSYFTPALFEMMLKLADQYGCAIRRPQWELGSDPSESLPAPYTKEGVAEMHRLLAQYHPRTTDGFTDEFYGDGATLENLLAILSRNAEGSADHSLEIMTHPAVVDAELRAASTYNETRGLERVLLQHPQMLAYIESHSIELINFAQL